METKNKYVDRNDALNIFAGTPDIPESRMELYKKLYMLPVHQGTIKREAFWTADGNCSICGRKRLCNEILIEGGGREKIWNFPCLSPYCPHCGATMRNTELKTIENECDPE